MRRVGVFLLALAGCTFDATGLGETPQTGAGAGPTTTGSTTEMGPASDAGPTGSSTTEDTLGVSGSESMTDGTAGPGGDLTSMPTLTTTTEPDTTTTTQPMTSTTTPETTGCPLVMAYKDFDNDYYGDPNTPMLVCEGEQGWVPDNTDCNDMSANAHPGVTEMCDTIDNDCDGVFDEYDAETNSDSCGNCKFRVREGSLYYFCSNELDWEPAEQFCVTHGLHLAKDDGGDERTFLLQEMGNTGLWWIGGNDRMTEDTFQWVSDGTNVAGDSWGNNEPNDQEWWGWEDADCMLLVDSNGVVGYPGGGTGGKWADHMCDNGFKFICEGPLP
ncbi:Lectin C-type domain-containing protein [Nannocystis exedens]|uniref:Lectin C-type domain-containing protein n=1 Tax=Nannocystis exedens TaxID=54 RepID=A0A1I1VDW8_9BACT|nr:MopE-related protein [Nannocystis exedens]PCC72411.1 T9SS C-terminal target domain-containing protein [Nannocystis exedens]SFD78660.1 Lectin C-type domain-containing protein [Nannocystis exedens]